MGIFDFLKKDINKNKSSNKIFNIESEKPLSPEIDKDGLKFFYSDTTLDKNIDGSKPEKITLTIAIEYFNKLFKDKAPDFIGFVDHKDKCIQFVCVDMDKWLVEVPYYTDQITVFQQYANYEECIEIIKTVFLKKEIIIFPKMKSVKI